MRLPAADVQVGDHVEMKSLGQFGFAEGSVEASVAEFEFGVVESLEFETADCVRIEFENFPSVGLPLAFEVEVDDDQAAYVRRGEDRR